jgi:hypothetical protein
VASFALFWGCVLLGLASAFTVAKIGLPVLGGLILAAYFYSEKNFPAFQILRLGERPKIVRMVNPLALAVVGIPLNVLASYLYDKL